MATTWRLIDTGYKDPYINMAIDEAVVQLIGPSDIPVLRFFDWSSPSISIGYSQKIKDVLDVQLCKNEGIQVVRRFTGGGVVFHGVDITYSVMLPKRFEQDVKVMYNMIQSWIKKGLDRLGINTKQYKEIKREQSSYCFVSPSFGDIMIENHKIGGLAGRRIKQRMLCEGYLYFEDASNMFKFAKDIKFYDMVYLSSLCEEKEKIKASIISNWCGKLIKDSLNDKEKELADSLCGTKYSQDEWNFMR